MESELKKLVREYGYVPQRNVSVFGRKINIPVLYPDATAVMIFLTAPRDKILSLMGKSANKLKPVTIWKNKTIFAITLFDYKQCEIGAYREFTFTIPVVANSRFIPPFLPLIFDSFFKSFGFFVLKLGANSDLSREHIKQIFPYPLYEKDAEVKIEENDRGLFASLIEDNREILTIEGHPKITLKHKLQKKRYNTYFEKDNNLFKVKLDTFSFLSQSFRDRNVSLRLNDHVLVEYIKQNTNNTKPLGIMYFKKAVEIAGEPELF